MRVLANFKGAGAISNLATPCFLRTTVSSVRPSARPSVRPTKQCLTFLRSAASPSLPLSPSSKFVLLLHSARLWPFCSFSALQFGAGVVASGDACSSQEEKEGGKRESNPVQVEVVATKGKELVPQSLGSSSHECVLSVNSAECRRRGPPCSS